ncbi:MAG: hypothetical protein M0Z85_00050 [Gammaproteobacteria bacterium]|nr:hypothetical protein [Gammaproteobacteria bacterium]
MAFPELRLLGKWTNSNPASTGLGKAANTYWAPPALATTEPSLPMGYLNGKQVGEVQYAVITSPVSANGTIEDLRSVSLVLDNEDYQYVYLSGRQDTNMAPDPRRIRRGTMIKFGEPFYRRDGKLASVVDVTCPKFITSVSIRCEAGDTAITDDYTVELWGFVYDSIQLAKMAPVYSNEAFPINDPLNQRAFVVPSRAISSRGDWRNAWTSLPGGMKQSTVGSAVYRMIRHARNQNATTPSQGYRFQYQNSSEYPAVRSAHDNLFFQLSASQAMVVLRMGVRSPQPTSAGAELLSAWINTDSEQQHRHPQGGIPVGFNQNLMNFGLSQGETNKFDALPMLVQGQQLLTDQEAYLTVVDNGQSIAANAIMVAMDAVVVDAGGGNTL